MRNIFVAVSVAILFYMGISFVANVTQLANGSDRIYLRLGQFIFFGC